MYSKNIGIMGLGGIGDTIMLSDIAKKVYEHTGDKPTLIIREGAELFTGNPHVLDIVQVGDQHWVDCFLQNRYRYRLFCVVRNFTARFYNGDIGTEPHKQLQFAYDNHIIYRFPQITSIFDTESLRMFRSQMVALSVGLPTDIAVKAYADNYFEVPKEFLVISSVRHVGSSKKLWNTRQWPLHHCMTFISLQKMPVLQLGTKEDTAIPGAIDLRGKTSLLQVLYILKKAACIISIEGGLMHLAYAVNAPRVVILQGPTASYETAYPGHVIIEPYVCKGCWGQCTDWHTKCIREIDMFCMRSITPYRVNYAVRRLLDEDLAEN